MDRQKVHWIRKKLLQEAAVPKCIRKLDAWLDGAAVHTMEDGYSQALPQKLGWVKTNYFTVVINYDKLRFSKLYQIETYVDNNSKTWNVSQHGQFPVSVPAQSGV